MPRASHPGLRARAAAAGGPVRTMGDLRMTGRVLQARCRGQRAAGRGGVGQPGGWTPLVLDGKVAAVVQVGNKLVGRPVHQGGQAAAPHGDRPSNIFAFDATTGAIDSVRAGARRPGRVAPWPRRPARVRRRQLHQDQRGRPEEPGQAAPQRRGQDHGVQGQDQRPGQGHGRQRRAALHRRRLQDRQRRGPQRPGRLDPVTGASRPTSTSPSPVPATAPSTSTSSTSPGRVQADRYRQLDLWPACSTTRSSCSTWPPAR